MPNPSIEELRNSGQFELIAQLNHSQIKEFVINQLTQNGKIRKRIGSDADVTANNDRRAECPDIRDKL